MAIALQCDICGVLYETYNCKEPDRGKPNMMELVNRVPGWSGNRDIRTYDCCPDCMDAIHSLIESRKPEGD